MGGSASCAEESPALTGAVIDELRERATAAIELHEPRLFWRSRRMRST